MKYKDRYYIPYDKNLRQQIIKEHHDTRITGHPGWRVTLELLQREYWWPGMTQFVKRYVEGCATCQKNKVITHPAKLPLQAIGTPKSNRPFAGISMDLIVKLPKSEGYDSILVVVDQGLSKGVKFIPCNETIDAMGIANLLIENLYSQFGLPDYIILDRGPQFASKVSGEMANQLGYERKLSTAYHTQTNGATERVNQELEAYLRIFCANEPSTWKNTLKLAEFAHNHKPHSARGMSPFEIIMGYQPKAFPSVPHLSKVPAVDERLKRTDEIRNEGTWDQ